MINWGTDNIDSVIFPVQHTEPLIVAITPTANATGIKPPEPLGITFLSVNSAISPANVSVAINGVSVYTGQEVTLLHSTSYRIVVNTQGTHLIRVKILPIGGWDLDSKYTVVAQVTNAVPNTTTTTWSFHTRSDTKYYQGDTPLDIENALLTPVENFIAVEPLRKALLQGALRATQVRTRNKEAKAARVVYKYAYLTELSSLLNIYNLRNERALATQVKEQASPIELDKTVMDIRGYIDKAIADLHGQGAITDAVARQVADYADSTLHHYRVSLVANLVLIAKALER